MNLKDLNAELEQRIKELRTIPSESKAQNHCVNLTVFLDSIIDEHPLIANAVHIALDPVAVRKESCLSLVRAYEKLRNGNGKPNTFTLHLPFRFSTGTHGSGERQCLAISCQSVTFQRGMDGTKVMIDLSKGYLMDSTRVYAPLNTIANMHLEQVADESYSLPFKLGGDALVPAETYLDQYLRFRGYSARHPPEEDLKSVIGWNESCDKIFKRLTFPDRRTDALKYDFHTGLLNGRCVLREENPAVIEFHDVPFPKGIYRYLDSGAAMATVAIANKEPSLIYARGRDKVIENLHNNKTGRII